MHLFIYLKEKNNIKYNLYLIWKGLSDRRLICSKSH